MDRLGWAKSNGPSSGQAASDRGIQPSHATSGPERIVNVPVGHLFPAEDNPRESSGDFSELAHSVESVGVLQPLIVTQESGLGYRIVCGERRWRASIEAGLSTVPCLVRTLDDRQRQELMLIENLHRRTLRPLEEARAYGRLLKLGYTQTSIAERLGRSQSHICRRLALLRLPTDVQVRVDHHEMRVNEALGYEAVPGRDVFAADERLHLAWTALREEIITKGDRKLARLLHDFATAYVERARFAAPVHRDRQTRMSS